jgi:microcystin-dependent protein
MEKNNIIFIVIFIVLVYIIYRLPSMEQMSNVDKATEDKIREIYKIDTDAIRNLSNLAKDLTINNKLKVPGGLDLDGPFNIIPKGVIVAWNSKDAPAGWALCNGQNGTPDLRGRFIRMWNDVGFKQDHAWHGGATNSTVRINGVNPQDSLRSGSRGLNHGYIMKHHFNDMGGTDIYNLQVVEMPAHSHGMNAAGNHTHNLQHKNGGRRWNWQFMSPNAYFRGLDTGGKAGYDRRDDHQATINDMMALEAGNHTHAIHNTGNGWGHGVSNPYYVLTYIMKL